MNEWDESADADLPSYQRTLASFSDEVITRVRQTHPHVWYAVLDAPPTGHGGAVDFSTGAATRAEAIRQCARKIRDDQRGIGTFAPHSLDLWSLKRWWSQKEARR